MLLIVSLALTGCGKDEFTVTFDSNGGSSVSSQTVTDGNSASEPAGPTKDGYTFDGWYASGSDTAFDFSTAITANITLTAQWTADAPAQADTFTVSFDCDVDSQTISSGDKATEPTTPTKEGYTFDGWFAAECETAFDFDTAITADLALTAKWTINSYTVTFDEQNGTTAEGASMHYGATIVAPESNPTKTATAELTFAFASWNTSADGTGDDFVADSTVSGDITYYAQYTSVTNSYTVTFDEQNGTTAEGASMHYGATIVAPESNPTKTATAELTFAFASWNTSADGTGDDFVADSTVSGDITYYAQYTSVTNSYTVTITAGDNGSVDVTSIVNVPYGSVITVSDNTIKIGDTTVTATASADTSASTFAFGSWSVVTGDTTDDNTTIIATFSDTTLQYTYTFYNSDGITVVSTATVDYGTAVVAPEYATKEATAQYEYAFVGWFTATTDGTEVAEFGNVTADVDYYAQYIELTRSYTITWYNGNIMAKSSSQAYGADVAVPADPTKDSTVDTVYTFIGWNTLEDGTGTDFVEDSTVTGSAVYYAQYTESTRTYTVTFGSESSTLDYGATISAPITNPTKDSTVSTEYTFAGWFTEATGGTQVTDFGTVTGSVTYYAQYTESTRTYTVTFGSESSTLDYGATISAPITNPTKDSTVSTEYTFAGWFTEATGGTQVTDFGTVTGSVTYYAQYTESTRTYTVTFGSQSSTLDYGATISAPTTNPTKDSTVSTEYTFSGWNTHEDGLGDTLSASTTVTGDVQYYAQYTESTRTYTVTFDGVAYTLGYGATITAPTTNPTKDSTVQYTYTFASWNTASDGTGDTLTDSTTVNSNVAYYAQYTVSGTLYELSFDTNGGTGEMEDIQVAYNSAIGTLPTVTYTGMVFLGWYIDDELVDNTTVWTYSSNQTAVAQWEASIDILTNISQYGETFGQVWESELMYIDDTEIITSVCNSIDGLDSVAGNITAIGAIEICSVPLLIQLDSVSMADKLDGVEISFDSGDGLVYYTLTAVDNICYIDSYSVYSLLILGEVPVYDNGIYYSQDMTSIIRATSSVSGDITIPNTVTSIASSAFANNDQISSVTFGGTSTSAYVRTSFVRTDTATVTCDIADYAFYACFNLTEVIFEEGSTISSIGEGAFMRCSSLYSIVGIECADIVSIGDYAFASCFNLQYFYVPDSVVTLGSYIFQNCVNMQMVEIGEDSQLVTISDYCFAGITFSSINIPASVQYIGKYAFYETGLTSVTFAEDSNLQTIDIYAFYNCQITSLEFPASVVSIGAYAFYSDVFGIQSITFAQDGSLTTIGNYAFGMGGSWYFNTATELYIPASVVTIGEGAFSGFINLQTLEIAEDSILQYIGRCAFAANMESTISSHITLPSTVTYVGEYAFYLTGITMTIPDDNSLETIGDYAFFGVAIDSLVLTDAISFMGICAFENTGLNSVIIDADAQLAIIYPAVFGNTNITSIVIPDSVTTIAEFAFSGCMYLTTVTFSSSSQLTTIDMGAFYGCPIENFYLPATVSSVGESALSGSVYISVEEGSEYYCSIDGNLYSADGTVLVCVCTNATGSSTFVVPEGVVTIQSGAFSGGISFNTLALPSTLQYMTFSEFNANVITISADNPYYCIENGILYNGDKTILMQYVYAVGDTLTIPDSVVEISDSALCNAQYSYIVFGEDSQLTTIGQGAFMSSTIYSINIPSTVTYIGYDAFTSCRNLTTVTFADGIDLATIPMLAFADTAITSIAIPSSVTSIGEGAFNDCTSLITVIFAEDSSLRTIGTNAFYNTALTGELVLPIGVISIGDMAFGMTNITSVYIPVTVIYVGWDAFTDCQYLQLITCACGEMESLMMYGCEVVFSQEYEIFENYGYVIAGGSVYIVAYFGYEQEVFVPSEIEGLTVVSFGTVFAYHDEIYSIIIPSSVEYISDYAFAGCYNLMYLTFDGDSSITYIGDYAFYDANLVSALYLPAAVESIGAYAFGNNSLDALVIPTDSVLVTIGECAFRYSGISGEVYLPATFVLTEWSFAIFAGNNISQFVVAEGNSTAMAIDGNLYMYYNWGDVYELCLMQYATGSSATSLELSDDVVAIFPFAVMGATNLNFVTIPDTVYYIGDSAFYGCSSLAYIYLPESVQFMGSYVFSAPLTILCQSVADSGWYQWYEYGCTVIYDASPDYFLTVTFDSCGGSAVAGQLLNEGDMATVPVSPSLFGYNFNGWYVDEDCTQLYDFSTTLVESITLYAGWVEVEEFEYTAVSGGYELTKYNGTDSDIVVPSSYNGLPVVGIGEMAFVMVTATGDINYEQITSITLPDTITYIGDLAFAATSIVSIELPASVTSVGTSIFLYCMELQSVTMAYSATSQYVVVDNVMYSSDMTTLVACFVSMDTFVLPITVTTISRYAFEGLELNTLVLHQDIDIINIGAFEVESYLTVYTLFDQYSCPSGWNYAFNLTNTTIYFDGEWVYEDDVPTATVTISSSMKFTLVNDNYAYIVSYYDGSDEIVEIPSYYNGIQVIGLGSYWYHGTGMTTLILPDTIQYFYTEAFIAEYGYDFGTIDTLQYVYYGGTLADYLSITFDIAGTPTYNGAVLYIDGQLLTELVITGDMVAYIPDYAFYGNASITSVVIGEGVYGIGASAFRYCTNLVSVQLGEGVEYLANFAFGDCDSLASVYLSSTIIDVGMGAFRAAYVDFTIAGDNWYLLTNGTDLYTVEGTLLHGAVTSADGTYTVPDYITYIEGFAFSNNEYLTMFIIPEENSLYGMSELAVYWCDNLTCIIAPSEYSNSFWYCGGAGGGVIAYEEMYEYTIIANGGVFNVDSLQNNTLVISVTEDTLVVKVSMFLVSYDGLCYLLGDDFVSHDSMLVSGFSYMQEQWDGSSEVANATYSSLVGYDYINAIVWGLPITVTLNSGDYQFSDGGYTASFDTLSGSTFSVSSDYSITVPDGYIFVGWSLTEGGEVADYIYASTDIELYAVYKQSVTMTVDIDGGYVDITTAYDMGFEYIDGYLVYTCAEGSTVSADIIWMLMEIIYKDNSQLTSFVYYDISGNEYVPSQFGDYYNGMYLEFVIDQDIVLVSQWSITINIVMHVGEADIADEYIYWYNVDWYEGTMTTSQLSNSYFNLPTASNMVSMPDMYAVGWSWTPDGDIIADYILTGEEEIHLYVVWAELATVIVYFGDNTDSDMLEWMFDGNTSFDYCGDYLYINSYVGNGFYNIDIVNELGMFIFHYDGYEFAGYSTDPNGSELIDSSYTLTDYNELYMVWLDSNVTYTVTVDLDGGYYTDDAIGYLQSTWDEAIIYLDTDAFEFSNSANLYLYMLANYNVSPTMDGYTFMGFSYEQCGEVLDSYSTIYITTGTTLYAVWAETVTISYNIGELDLINDPYNNLGLVDNVYTEYSAVGASADFDFNTMWITEHCWKYGYYIAGWSLTEGGDMLDELIFDGDTTLYAVWLEGVTITLDGNGATIDDNTLYSYSDMYPVGDSQLVGYAEPNSYWAEWTEYSAWYYNFDNRVEYDGYYLVGFSYTPDGELVDSTALFIGEDDVTLYAIWAQYVTVTIYANGGTINSTTAYGMTVVGDTLVGECYPNDQWWYFYDYSTGFGDHATYTGYYFVGLSYTPDGDVITNSMLILGEEDVVLYAIWEAKTVVTIDANGGTLRYYSYEYVDGQLKVYADTDTVYLYEEHVINAASRSGYDYGYLSYDTEGYFAIDSYQFVENTTLYIQWIRNSDPMITLDANGGTITVDTWGEYEVINNSFVAYLEYGEVWLGDTTITLADCDFFYCEGYVLAGWSYTIGGDIIADYSLYITQDTVLYAVWVEPVTVTIYANDGFFTVDSLGQIEGIIDYTFDSIDGSDVVTVTVAPGDTTWLYSIYGTALHNFYYGFGGYSYSSDATNAEDIMEIYEDCTLYAIWTYSIV